jgi:hypothetical protein
MGVSVDAIFSSAGLANSAGAVASGGTVATSAVLAALSAAPVVGLTAASRSTSLAHAASANAKTTSSAKEIFIFIRFSIRERRRNEITEQLQKSRSPGQMSGLRL